MRDGFFDETIQVFQHYNQELILYLSQIGQAHVRGLANTISSQTAAMNYLKEHCPGIPECDREKVVESVRKGLTNPLTNEILETIITMCNDEIGFNLNLITRK